ncbi:MAG TPA: MFS transporter [Kofleriaceae bacterium]|nr:MFS transporter [Kofleriaceae bacterium]
MPPSATHPVGISERRLVFLIGAVQFTNILDFMIVMPLGPDFALALDIPSSQIGLVGGAYTAAAAIAGIAGAFFLDRFDRRRALAVALAGLVLGTLAGGFATGLGTLLAARVVAGAFGGPATALALAIVSDAVPPDRRGRAMGAVMGAFSVASVLGVPAGLELARLAGWRAPFFTVAALGAIVAASVVAMLPAQTAHLRRRLAPTPFREVLRRPVVMLALTGTAVASIAHFALIPNLSAYFQFNRGYPREGLGLLYLVGGAVSFGTMRLAGWMADRHGVPAVSAGGALAFAAVLVWGFIYPSVWFPVLPVFVGFMVTGSFRFVPMQALWSRVPDASERARFMSAQSAMQHFASAAGAMIGAQILTERADGGLAGMDDLAWASVATTIVLPVLLYLVDRRVRAREQSAPATPAEIAAGAAPVTGA